jgi:hypothetical protein
LLLLAGVASAQPVLQSPRAWQQIVAPGVPGPLCVYGRKARVTAVGGSGNGLHAPVAATAPLGRGRIAAFGHGGYFHGGALGDNRTRMFIQQTVGWAANSRRPVIFHHRLPAAASVLGAIGEWDGTEIPEQCEVLVADASVLRDPKRFARIEKWIRGGGGFVTASLGWGWKQLNPGKDLLTDHAGNRLLAKAGVVWADGYLKKSNGRFPQPKQFDLDLHAREALTGKRESPQAVQTLTTAVHALPVDDALFRPRLEAALRGVNLERRRSIGQGDGLARVAFAWTVAESKRAPVNKVVPHPWALRFPGSVAKAVPRVKKTVEIDTRVPRWHSTGLYAAPGAVISISGAARGLSVRIGAHTDRLWQKKEWNRAPEVSRRWPLQAGTTRVANAFGGHVYIEVPKNARPEVREVEIAGAVEAPWFVLGETKIEEWPEIRMRKAPWAELGTDKMIVTLPSRAVRQLDDPRPVLEFWNSVMDACADLRQMPRERRSPERFVCDRQISVGYMHSGYPLMCHLDQEGWLGNVERLRKGNWGLFHEIGHNHQVGDWTFGGTTEVTVNLFTLFVYEKICGIDRPRPNLYGEHRAKTIAEYRKMGRKFSYWKKKPFLALIMYMQLQEAFGWEAFQQVFKNYQGAKKPRNDAEKRDLWMIRFSRHVGRNLGPFFDDWGVPTSEQARNSLTDLPVWMPE